MFGAHVSCFHNQNGQNDIDGFVSFSILKYMFCVCISSNMFSIEIVSINLTSNGMC